MKILKFMVMLAILSVHLLTMLVSVAGVGLIGFDRVIENIIMTILLVWMAAGGTLILVFIDNLQVWKSTTNKLIKG